MCDTRNYVGGGWQWGGGRGFGEGGGGRSGCGWEEGRGMILLSYLEGLKPLPFCAVMLIRNRSFGRLIRSTSIGVGSDSDHLGQVVDSTVIPARSAILGSADVE